MTFMAFCLPLREVKSDLPSVYCREQNASCINAIVIEEEGKVVVQECGSGMEFCKLTLLIM